MVPPRSCTPLLRKLLELSSLVTLPSPAPTTSEPPTSAVCRPGSRSSAPLLLMPRHMPAAHTLTSVVSQVARPDILPGSAPTPRLASTVQNHFQLISSRQFSSFTYDCSTCTNAGSDGYVSAYIFRPRDCNSVTDESLDQLLTNMEKSTSAVPTGASPILVRIPRPERSYTCLPISPSTAALQTTQPVRLRARTWPSTIPLKPSSTLTAMSTSLRTALLCLERYRHCALGRMVSARNSEAPDLCNKLR